MNEKLTEQQAMTVLVNAVRIGQKAGVYSIEEAELIAQAIRTFLPPTQPEQENGPVASE